MNEHETPVPVLQAILDELQQLHMEQTVQRGAYLVLARQLALRGYLEAESLAADLRQMEQTQGDPLWRVGFANLANALLSACIRTSGATK